MVGRSGRLPGSRLESGPKRPKMARDGPPGLPFSYLASGPFSGHRGAIRPILQIRNGPKWPKMERKSKKLHYLKTLRQPTPLPFDEREIPRRSRPPRRSGNLEPEERAFFPGTTADRPLSESKCDCSEPMGRTESTTDKHEPQCRFASEGETCRTTPVLTLAQVHY